jgi:NagD protein
MATAQFLANQRPHGTAFVIGESGLTSALHDVGYVLTNINPDYVVLGETTSYQFATITKAIRLITAGARFIATNPDTSGPTEAGIEPACGAMAALIEAVTNKKPYFIGKPNPLMMRSALNFIGAHSENTIMVGDRMDTDVIGGIEAGTETILVLTGVTSRDQISQFSFQPTRVLESVADIKIE